MPLWDLLLYPCDIVSDNQNDTLWSGPPFQCKDHHLTSIGNPIVEISTMGFPILVRWHLYIESRPSIHSCCTLLLCRCVIAPFTDWMCVKFWWINFLHTTVFAVSILWHTVLNMQTTVLPEASFGLRVLLLPASICVCPSVRHQVCPCNNSCSVQARVAKFRPEV